MKTTLKIEGMSCQHCISSVAGALNGVAGVTNATVDLAAGSAEVEHDNVPMESLIAAVEAEGYRAKTD